MKALFTLAALAATQPTLAILPKVLLSSNPSHPQNIIPGGLLWQTGSTPFDDLYFSPDRTRWALSGEREAGATDHDIIVRGTTSPWTVTDVVAMESLATGFGAETYVVIRDGISIANDGTVCFAADTNGPTTSDDIVVSWNGSPTLLAREGNPVPSLTNVFFGSYSNFVNSTNDGRVRWISTGLTGSGVVPGQSHMIYQVQGPNSNVLVRSSVTTPLGQLVMPSQPTYQLNPNQFTSAAESGDFLYSTSIYGPGTSNSLIVVNNDTLLQKSQTFATFPGSLASLVSTTSHSITADGLHTLLRCEILDSVLKDVWVLDGAVIAATEMPITQTESELWSSSSFSRTFSFAAVNKFGETCIGGKTTNPNPAQDFVITFQAAGKSEVVFRQGDAIDLNGNGLADDNAFASDFDDDSLTLTEGNIIYFSLEVEDGSGNYIGDAVVTASLPLTGDVDGSGEVDAADIDQVIAAFGSTSPGISEDVDGSGEVDAADIDIVIRNFGRTR